MPGADTGSSHPHCLDPRWAPAADGIVASGAL